MIEEWKSRTAMMVGEDGVVALAGSTVVVVGVGGVGGYAAEMVVRAGVGHIVIMDDDLVSESNRNRQLIALTSTVGKSKTDVLKSRLLDINPALEVTVLPFYLEDGKAGEVLGPFKPDFVIDAIDTVAPKLSLIKWCYENRIPSVSSMGAGAKSDATRIRIADISKTFNCSLAFVVRKRLRKMGITKGVKVVFSEELPDTGAVVPCQERNKCSNVGSISYIPAVFGCCCAQACIQTLLSKCVESQ